MNNFPHGQFESVTCPKCQKGPFSPKLLEGIIRLIRHYCLTCHFEWFEIPKEDES